MRKVDPEGLSRKEWNARLRKLRNKISISFESLQDRDAVAPALLGQTYHVAEQSSGLSPGQVAYRMKLAREIYGLPKGIGFARQWRDGSGVFAKTVQKKLLPSVLAMLLRDLPKARLHPTPKVSPQGQREEA